MRVFGDFATAGRVGISVPGIMSAGPAKKRAG
jgi:hypothetical protein